MLSSRLSNLCIVTDDCTTTEEVVGEFLISVFFGSQKETIDDQFAFYSVPDGGAYCCLNLSNPNFLMLCKKADPKKFGLEVEKEDFLGILSKQHCFFCADEFCMCSIKLVLCM